MRLPIPSRVELADAGVPPKQPRWPHARRDLGFGLGLALALAASLSWMLYSQSQSSPKIRSLAVLPLESLSGDASQDYFADGMTDAVDRGPGANQRVAGDLTYVGNGV